MYNDFIIVGPKIRSGRDRGRKDTADGTQEDRRGKAPFASRGDKSGTHAAELRLWQVAGIDTDTGKGVVVSRNRLGHGADAQHRLRHERLCA